MEENNLENKEENKEEKTLDVVVSEYEKKLEKQRETYESQIRVINENHAKEIRAILSGEKIDTSKTGKKDDEEKSFFAKEIEKTKEKLKLKWKEK